MMNNFENWYQSQSGQAVQSIDSLQSSEVYALLINNIELDFQRYQNGFNDP